MFCLQQTDNDIALEILIYPGKLLLILRHLKSRLKMFILLKYPIIRTNLVGEDSGEQH